MMKIRMMVTMMTALTILMAFAAIPAFSGDGSPDTMQIIREKIKADKKMLVALNMDLTDAEAEKFWPLYEEYQAAIEAILVRYAGLINTYATNYQKMTDETAGEILNDFLSIEADLVDIRKSYLPKFKAVLPVVKVARYYQIENKIQAVVRYDAAANIPLM
jgi:hypothetical protein